jgi:hypothetical protein
MNPPKTVMDTVTGRDSGNIGCDILAAAVRERPRIPCFAGFSRADCSKTL